MSAINLTIPTGWNQLTAKQILMVCRLHLSKLTQQEFRLKAFLTLTGMKALNRPVLGGYYSFSIKGQLLRIHQEEMVWLLKSVDFLLGDCQLSVNRFPSFRIGFRRYFGPSNKCYNLTLNEYIHASASVYKYQMTEDLKHIDTLCAILYRNRGKGSNESDPRERFDDYGYLKNQNRFARLPKHKKLAVMMFFLGCQYELNKAFPHLLSNSTISSEPLNPVPHLQKMVRLLNTDDITKNRQVLNSPLWEAFAQLDDRIENITLKKKNGKV